MVVPRYDDGGFAALPDTVARLLGVGQGGVALDSVPARARHVVLVLLDAFGWRFFTRHGDHPLLARFDAVVPLTTQFPSTTTVHVTTLHSGVPVGEHGLYEWNVLEPSLGALVTPLLFCYAGDAERDTLLRAGAEPGFLRPPGPTLYERLAQAGVASHVFGPANFTPSTFDSVLARAARDVHPVADLPSGLAELAATLHAVARAGLRVPVLGRGRLHRPPARAVVAAVRRVGPALPRRARRRAARPARGHGRAPGRRPRAGRRRPSDDGLRQRGVAGASSTCWPADRRGRPLAPAGSARDLFLHCRPGRHR